MNIKPIPPITQAAVDGLNYLTPQWMLWANRVSGLCEARYGDTASRPTVGIYPGMTYYDTDFDMPIWVNKDSNGWVDATGTPI